MGVGVIPMYGSHECFGGGVSYSGFDWFGGVDWFTIKWSFCDE